MTIPNTLAMTCDNTHQKLGPMSPQLMPVRTVGLVLPFTSLSAAQKQPVQQQEDTNATTQYSQRHWWWPSLLMWTHNRRAPWMYVALMRSQFYKHWPTTIFHIYLKLCSYSATTVKWPFSGYRPILEINKQTRLQSNLNKQSNQVQMWAKKEMSSLPKHLRRQV